MTKRLAPARARQLVVRARSSPLNNPSTEYPAWYLQRWHFLPEGYLSRRSAAGYDHVIRNFYNAWMERRVIGSLARTIRAEGRRSVLELGCGPGRLVRALAASGAARRVVGVDLSPFMLERASRFADGAPGVELVHTDGTDLPWPDAEFDTVVAMHHFGHLPPEVGIEALSEAARVLQPGGTLYTVDHSWHDGLAHSQLRLRDARSRLMGVLRLNVLERVAGATAQEAFERRLVEAVPGGRR